MQTQFFSDILTREVLGKLEVNEVDGKNVYTMDDYLGQIFDYIFTHKTGSLPLSQMSFQNTFVDNLKSFVASNEFSVSQKSLTAYHSEATTCSCHAYCNRQSNFESIEPLSDIAMAARIDKPNKLPIVHKYLKKAYQVVGMRHQTGDDKTRNHYQMLQLKLNYLFK